MTSPIDVRPRRRGLALAVLAPAAEEFADLGDDPGMVALLSQLARAYMLNEEPELSLEAAERASKRPSEPTTSNWSRTSLIGLL